MIELSNRLGQIARMVQPGSVVADIGTDHGQLMVYLAQNGTIRRGYACDINEKPLNKARQIIADYGLEDRIECVLASGLDGLQPGSVDTVVIAGMGGELIAQILQQAPWVKSEDKHLILQPMTTAKELRLWLRENGFVLLEEKCVRSEGKIYSVLLAVYAPEKVNSFQNEELYPYIGLLTGKTMEEREYIEKVIHRLSKKLLGCRHRQDEAGAEKIERILRQLEKMAGMEREES